jgi:glycosyltransferase involved in cell wall biosynthesis
MRRIVLGDPVGSLGEVCEPSDPTAVAAALRAILELGPADRDALRARCLAAAHERWNWPGESRRLFDLYAALLGGAPPAPTLASGDRPLAARRRRPAYRK